MFSSLRKLSPRYLLDWRTQLMPFIWLIYVHVIDQEFSFGDTVPRLAVLLASYLAFVLTLALIKKLWLDKKPSGKSHLLPITVALLISGLVRGVIFAALLEQIGYRNSTDPAFRIVASALNATSATLVGSVLVTSMLEHSKAIVALASEQAELIYLRDVALAQSQLAHQKLVNETKARLSRIFSSLAKLPAEKFLQRIRTTIDDVVRPISYELERTTPPIPKKRMLPEESKFKWRQVLEDATRPGAIRAVEITVFTFFVVISAAVSKFGTFWAGAVVIYLFTFGLAVMWLAGKLVDPILKSAPFWARVLALSAMLFTGSWIIKICVAPIAIQTQNPTYFDNFSPFFSMLSGLGFAIGHSALEQSAKVQSAMAEITQRLAWDAARASELQRQRYRNLARALHGSIQALLASTYLKAEAQQKRSGLSESYRQKVSKNLISKLSDLDEKSPEPASLMTVLDQVMATWQGIATIHVETNPFVGDFLEQDPVCLTAVIDLIPELVFNSIKHGDAKHVFVSVKTLNDRVLELEVSNDGMSFAANQKLGLGSKLISESSLEWSRTNDAGLAITRVLLPFAPAA